MPDGRGVSAQDLAARTWDLRLAEPTEPERDAARRVVAGLARDAADCEDLLRVLGLLPPGHPETQAPRKR